MYNNNTNIQTELKKSIPGRHEIKFSEKKVSHLDSCQSGRFRFWGIPRPQNRSGDAEAPDVGYYYTESNLSVLITPKS